MWWPRVHEIQTFGASESVHELHRECLILHSSVTAVPPVPIDDGIRATLGNLKLSYVEDDQWRSVTTTTRALCDEHVVRGGMTDWQAGGRNTTETGGSSVRRNVKLQHDDFTTCSTRRTLLLHSLLLSNQIEETDTSCHLSSMITLRFVGDCSCCWGAEARLAPSQSRHWVSRIPLFARKFNETTVWVKKVAPETSCNIFTQTKYISVKFCHFVASLYPHIPTQIGVNVKIWHCLDNHHHHQFNTHRFTTSENIAKSFGGYFLTHTVDDLGSVCDCLHRKVNFLKMLYSNFELVTLKMSSLSYGPVTVISFIEICPCVPDIGEKMAPVLIWSCGLTVTLPFDLLTSKSNQFIFVPVCTEVVNLVKLPQAVYQIWC